MSNSQRWLIIGALIALSLFLPLHFLAYASDAISSETGVVIFSSTFYPANQLPTTQNDYYSGYSLTTGLFARYGLSSGEALFTGLILPAALLIAAGYLFLGRQRTV